MSESTAIRVANLGKKYVLGGAERADVSFREMLVGALATPFRRLKRLQGERSEEESFWALKDVNFKIMPGEVVGVIGRNGAGKSTLLKVLSRITDPTEGRVEIRGRVSSLLEVGTGFHPELTGRENVFLNGAILGMTRSEIRSKFDEIVTFAEVEKFLDTPVKRYSSGMYVRLAFAVAAHLEPEILVVDEVLAVGDAAFQKKCLGRMQDVGKEGRTVIFVSHNMSAVNSLCHRAILLQGGKVVLDDEVGKVLPYYMGEDSPESIEYFSNDDVQGPHVKALRITQEKASNATFGIDKPIQLLFKIETFGQKGLDIGLRISNVQGVCVHHSCSSFISDIALTDDATLICTIPPYGLAPGRYSVEFRLFKNNYQGYDRQESALVFDVELPSLLDADNTQHNWEGVCGPGILQWRCSCTK